MRSYVVLLPATSSHYFGDEVMQLVGVYEASSPQKAARKAYREHREQLAGKRVFVVPQDWWRTYRAD